MKANSRFQSEVKINLLPNCKRSQSQIISTILLILLAVSAAAIIMAFAIPFVNEQLSASNCFEVADKIEITNNPQYTCYDNTATPEQMRVQVHIKDTEDIQGFIIELSSDSSQTYTIKDNTQTAGVTMFNNSPNLQLPSQNQETTYKIDSATKPETVRVYPILTSGKTCETSQTALDVNDCYTTP